MPSVLIVGGGVIGLTAAWRLAQAGHFVTVIERQAFGSGASNAAAGMLAPQIEAEPGEENLLPLLLAARETWPAFADELQEFSGITIGYRREGTLMVAADADEYRIIKRHYDYLNNTLHLPMEWLEGNTLKSLEPCLSPSIVAGFKSPLDHQVDARLLIKALIKACEAAGVNLLPKTIASELIIAKETVTGVRALMEPILADAVLLCGGAWTRLLRYLPPSVKALVRPVKGQMLALRMEDSYPLLSHVVWGEKIYLVPKADGRLLLGATVEDVGFDEGVTAGGMLHLLEHAETLLPSINELKIIESWASFRPGSLDDAPIVGETPLENLYILGGHYRNGILLAPLTASLTPTLIGEKILPPLWQPYTMARFSGIF
jgi:glycine oxidase